MTDSIEVINFISAKQTRNCYVVDRLHMKDMSYILISCIKLTE